MLYLNRDLQSNTAQDLSTPASRLQVRTLPEWVAVEKVWQDGVEDLMRHIWLNNENCVAQFESDSLFHVETGDFWQFLWVNLRLDVQIAGMNWNMLPSKRPPN